MMLCYYDGKAREEKKEQEKADGLVGFELSTSWSTDECQVCWWRGSNLGTLVSEATTLPPAPTESFLVVLDQLQSGSGHKITKQRWQKQKNQRPFSRELVEQSGKNCWARHSVESLWHPTSSSWSSEAALIAAAAARLMVLLISRRSTSPSIFQNKKGPHSRKKNSRTDVGRTCIFSRSAENIFHFFCA